MKITKQHFKDYGKKAMWTAAEVGVVTGSMIASKKFFDFNKLFENKIKADPKFADNFLIKHQGAVKFVAGCAGAGFIKNPWIKLLLIGMAAEGLVTEVRLLTTASDGAAFFDKIGANILMSGEETELDKRIKAAAIEAENNMSGNGQENPTDRYPTAVGYSDFENSSSQDNPADNYPTAVGKVVRLIPSFDSDNGGNTGVGAILMQY